MIVFRPNEKHARRAPFHTITHKTPNRCSGALTALFLMEIPEADDFSERVYYDMPESSQVSEEAELPIEGENS